MVTHQSHKDHGRTEFRAGDSISLSCDGAPSNCSSIIWLFSYKNGRAEALFEKAKLSEGNKERLHVTKECSLEVKTLREEDEGRYTCRSFPSAREEFDHATHQLELMTSTSRPTTTKVKANTTCTSTSEPTTPAVKGGPGLIAGVALGTAVLLIVGLVLLIRWHRRRGNKRPKDPTTIGLNSIRDTPPVIGGLHDEHLSVDGDQGGGPTYASIVLPEGQRSVATAQVEDDSSDAVTYASVRASPRCGEKAGDVDVQQTGIITKRL
ncbi:paired immunoglobulin-like type 2 receptor alpha isoform X12 [Gadus macrocephalus]|uniref:paired immunoglobulin-like type 2 receptor alpha isoform X12 n=1 Tax=Gadus macrocephalus TaxID=80720 RepID=UPI0028CB8E55|nr:paired immunoglobulin-like type 2 receptor alpha isoform X12 [Gadus macrocephalus]